MDSLSAGMIFVSALALIILLALVIFTWIKWRKNEIRKALPRETFSHENGPVITVEPPKEDLPGLGYDNFADKMKSIESITGSRTILTEESFKSGDVAFHGNVNDPRQFRSADVVYHTNWRRNEMVEEAKLAERDRSKTWL